MNSLEYRKTYIYIYIYMCIYICIMLRQGTPNYIFTLRYVLYVFTPLCLYALTPLRLEDSSFRYKVGRGPVVAEGVVDPA